jgi:hypothetical protein
MANPATFTPPGEDSTDEAEAFRAYRRGEAPLPDLDAIGAIAMTVSEFEDPRAFEPMITIWRRFSMTRSSRRPSRRWGRTRPKWTHG